MQSNPIQQRIELMAEKWDSAKTPAGVRVVCLRCAPDELDMADAFYTYFLGSDTPLTDIGFLFESRCFAPEEFSQSLVDELAEVIHIWNNSQKDERIDYTPVNWQPVAVDESEKNKAALFVQNFNRLAGALQLPEGSTAVAIFKNASLDKAFPAWLRSAVEAGIGANVRFLLHEVVGSPRHTELERKHPDLFSAVPLALNMPQAMEQLASMGDPTDPATAYRRTFMQLFNAMTKGNEAEAEKRGRECLAMATENLAKDPYWALQIVTVNIALGNDKVRYKKKKETLAYANDAVAAADGAATFLDKQSAAALLSQALTFRATVHYTQGRWTDAHEDYQAAYNLFLLQGNLALAVEAGRMGGTAALKSGAKKAGIELWVAAARLGEKMDAETARASTYAVLLKRLLESDYHAAISSEELHGLAQRIYGEEWASAVRGSAKTPSQTTMEPVAEPIEP